jgi:hypothetical protein
VLFGGSHVVDSVASSIMCGLPQDKRLPCAHSTWVCIKKASSRARTPSLVGEMGETSDFFVVTSGLFKSLSSSGTPDAAAGKSTFITFKASSGERISSSRSSKSLSSSGLSTGLSMGLAAILCSSRALAVAGLFARLVLVARLAASSGLVRAVPGRLFAFSKTGAGGCKGNSPPWLFSRCSVMRTRSRTVSSEISMPMAASCACRRIASSACSAELSRGEPDDANWPGRGRLPRRGAFSLAAGARRGLGSAMPVSEVEKHLTRLGGGTGKSEGFFLARALLPAPTGPAARECLLAGLHRAVAGGRSCRALRPPRV